jgi:hypothetical protein
MSRGTYNTETFLIPHLCPITGDFVWLRFGGFRREDPLRNPQAVWAREFIKQWNSEVAAESIVWSALDLQQLVRIAQGTTDVSQCTFTDDPFRDDPAEAEGSERFSGRVDHGAALRREPAEC